MTPMSHTPADLKIQPRDLSFDKGAPARRWWLNGDPIASAFYDALSATFPHGERFFMDSVRRYRDVASPGLKAQIAAFLSQEAMHTREHIVFNKQIASHGFDVAGMEARTKANLDFARTRGPLQQLGATIALEHFTAILAHAVLSDPRHLEGAPEALRAMWRWHAIEEIEHKAVAFDTFMEATASMSGLRRWALRASTMIGATGLLIPTLSGNINDILKAAGKQRGADLKMLGFLLFKPGILRQVLGSYFSYFLPGFHPWWHDNRDLLEEVEQGLASGYAREVAA